MSTMNIPGFTADLSLHQKTTLHRISTSDHSPRGTVVPALPSKRTCEFAEAKCEACLESGNEFENCPTCKLLRWCSWDGFPISTGGGGGDIPCNLKCGEARADCYRTGLNPVVCNNQYTECSFFC